jgi:hypothetical protein
MALQPLLPDPNDPIAQYQASQAAQAPPASQVSMPGAPPNLGTSLQPLVQTSRMAREQQLEQQLAPKGPSQGGFWHNVAHVASRIGNIAGDIVAPSEMMLIPGTDLHNQIQHRDRSNELAGLQAQDSEDAKQASANTTAASENALHSAQTAGLQQEQADKPSIDSADAAYKNAQAAALLHPQAKTEFESWQTQNPGKPISDWMQLKANSAPEKAGNDFEQFYKDYITDNNLPDSAHNRILARREYSAANQAPQRAPITNVMIPNAQGGYDVQGATAGSHVAGGAVTAGGMNSANTPTAQMRNTAQRAELVHAMTPELLQNIDSNASQLGPVMGHWNDFMQGKVGLDNPNFAQLRADLLLYSSSVALAHAQGRLPENLREEFDHMINSPKQSPENLKAIIGRVDQAMQLNAQVMGGRQIQTGGASSAGGPPPGAKVRDYTHLGGGK